MTIPLQRTLFLAVFIPGSDNDILAGAWQCVGGVKIMHFEAWWVTRRHLFGGIVVAVESNAVKLS